MPAGRKVALIRGINVGRSKRVPMAELRALIEDFGYTDVRTLLNSGNVVFTAPKDTPAESATRIEKALLVRVDVAARVVVLTQAQLSTMIAENTLLEVADDPSKLIVAVPLNLADLPKLEQLLAQDWDGDAIALGSRAAYLWCAGGILESRLPQTVSRTFKDAVTTRNWATMLKLQELLAEKIPGPVSA
jgi:uncharacterized protein (DUF1697 family)